MKHCRFLLSIDDYHLVMARLLAIVRAQKQTNPAQNFKKIYPQTVHTFLGFWGNTEKMFGLR